MSRPSKMTLFEEKSPSFTNIFMLRRPVLAIFALLSLLLLLGGSFRNFSFEQSHRKKYTSDDIARRISASNSTLGFQAIIVGITPGRTDQRDTITLLSYYSGLDITIVDGVDGNTILNKSLPEGKSREHLKNAELACWRVHMNIMNLIISKKIQSALILEADVDWDIRIKQQMESLSDHIPDSTSQHPYGLDWLFLWLGHCKHVADPSNPGPYVLYPDETVPDHENFSWHVKEEFAAYNYTEGHRRLIYRARTPLCTAAYAVTLEGALRALYEFGLHKLNKQIDQEYKSATIGGWLPGIAVAPPIMAQWKSGTQADSDIEVVKEKKIADGGTSGFAVQSSARRRLKEWAYGNDTVSTPYRAGWAHVGIDQI